MILAKPFARVVVFQVVMARFFNEVVLLFSYSPFKMLEQ